MELRFERDLSFDETVGEFLGRTQKEAARDGAGPKVADEEPVNGRIDEQANGEWLRSGPFPQARSKRRRQTIDAVDNFAELHESQSDQDLREPIGDLVEIRVRREEAGWS